MKINLTNQQYIYTYVYQINEVDLCLLEQRTFFGTCTTDNVIISDVKIDPTRSPYMRERVEVIAQSENVEDLAQIMSKLDVPEETFKVVCLNDSAFGNTDKIGQKKRQQFERLVAQDIQSEPDLDNPARIFALFNYDGIWYVGDYVKSVSMWLHHLHKPQGYSTALSTRDARAIANIAVPFPENIRAIDPCCGIGTVVIEALSMNINIVGRDISALVCVGARKNIEHFGYSTSITLGPIQEVEEAYDVAIIDLPYNVFTAATREDQYVIIENARRIAKRVVIVTIESVDDILQEVGLTVIDRGTAKKQAFKRDILLCE